MLIMSYTGKKRKCFDMCDACLRPDCGQCKYCCDKPKFRGRNTLKQYCAKRQCLKFDGSSILQGT